MTDVVERVARAMMEVRFASGSLKGSPVLASDPDYDDLPYKAEDYPEHGCAEPSLEEVHALARAALDALEEPTEAMSIAGSRQSDFCLPSDAAEIFSAMIRRAKEG